MDKLYSDLIITPGKKFNIKKIITEINVAPRLIRH